MHDTSGMRMVTFRARKGHAKWKGPAPLVRITYDPAEAVLVEVRCGRRGWVGEGWKARQGTRRVSCLGHGLGRTEGRADETCMLVFQSCVSVLCMAEARLVLFAGDVRHPHKQSSAQGSPQLRPHIQPDREL